MNFMELVHGTVHGTNCSLPASENRMRYIGARVECFVDAANEKDAICEMGVRHYWPNLCRFLQRDPNTYTKLPAPSNPKSVNPYIYADNNPVTKLDPSGYAAGQYRGARMGGASFQLGTGYVPANQIYDCCGPQGFHALSDMTLEFAQFYHTGQGSRTFGYWSGKEGKGLCDLEPEKAQPNTTCSKTTYMSSDLACTYLMCCKGASCGNPFTGSNQSCGGGDCILGFSKKITGEDLIPFTDSSDVRFYLNRASVEELISIMNYYNDIVTMVLERNNTGELSNLWGGSYYILTLINPFMPAQFPEDQIGCQKAQDMVMSIMHQYYSTHKVLHWKYYKYDDEGHVWVYMESIDYPGLKIKLDPWLTQCSAIYFVYGDVRSEIPGKIPFFKQWWRYYPYKGSYILWPFDAVRNALYD